ncbi:potassium/sodium hyperpolarization-activated cyclic nucleotide-gated channel protein [Carex rostrata]
MATSLRFLTLTLTGFPIKIPITTTANCSPSANPITDKHKDKDKEKDRNKASNSDSDASFDTPGDSLSATDPSFAISKRAPSAISVRSGPVLCPLEPPNFEIGWKRTKEIKNEMPKGWQIADFLEKLEGLMERGRFGSTKLLAKTVEIVAERAREEMEVLRAGGEVDERVVTELLRVLRLVELDGEMVKAAVKEETLKERIQTARARCRQAILVALSL